MSGLPPTHTLAVIDGQLPGVLAWAERRGWVVRLKELALRASTMHPAVGVPVEFVAELDGYNALPPAWHVVVPGTDQDAGPANFPSPGPLGGSIFHGNLVICAPWNRLAYKTVNANGPHEDWGGPEGWLSLPGDLTREKELGDMLASINLSLRSSPGMMG